MHRQLGGKSHQMITIRPRLGLNQCLWIVVLLHLWTSDNMNHLEALQWGTNNCSTEGDATLTVDSMMVAIPA